MGKLLSKLSNRRCHSWAKKLSYRWETCATLYISWNVVQITQTDRVSAWEALSATFTFYSATCIVLYTHHCTRHNYRTASMQCRACQRCHQQTSIQPNGPYLWSTTSTNTNVVYDTASVPSSTRTTVVDGHKFSAVRRLSRTLLDQSKNAIFHLPHLHMAPQLGVISSEFHRDLLHHKTRIPGLSCGAVFEILRLVVLKQYQLVIDRQTTTANTALG